LVFRYAALAPAVQLALLLPVWAACAHVDLHRDESRAEQESRVAL
jgi:hypothetical protein